MKNRIFKNGKEPSEDPLKPTAIFAEIKTHPPLMRDEAAQAYLGKYVEWPLMFASGSIWEGDAVRLTFHAEPNGVTWVVGIVSLAKYPWLKMLHADEPVRVCGHIRRIEYPMEIKLDVTHLVQETTFNVER